MSLFCKVYKSINLIYIGSTIMATIIGNWIFLSFQSLQSSWISPLICLHIYWLEVWSFVYICVICVSFGQVYPQYVRNMARHNCLCIGLTLLNNVWISFEVAYLRCWPFNGNMKFRFRQLSPPCRCCFDQYQLRFRSQIQFKYLN